MAFSRVYPHYINKVEKKGRMKHEVHELIFWLTGYNENDLSRILEDQTNFEDFFKQAPHLHPNAHMIIGVICGHRIEDIEEELMRKIRYLDKLVDELAKGRPMEKILRK
jgi:hypothetical protein